MSASPGINMLMTSPALDVIADEHRVWLSSFDAGYREAWELHRVANVETALAEAAIRRSTFGLPDDELSDDQLRRWIIFSVALTVAIECHLMML